MPDSPAQPVLCARGRDEAARPTTIDNDTPGCGDRDRMRGHQPSSGVVGVLGRLRPPRKAAVLVTGRPPCDSEPRSRMSQIYLRARGRVCLGSGAWSRTPAKTVYKERKARYARVPLFPFPSVSFLTASSTHLVQGLGVAHSSAQETTQCQERRSNKKS